MFWWSSFQYSMDPCGDLVLRSMTTYTSFEDIQVAPCYRKHIDLCWKLGFDVLIFWPHKVNWLQLEADVSKCLKHFCYLICHCS